MESPTELEGAWDSCGPASSFPDKDTQAQSVCSCAPSPFSLGHSQGTVSALLMLFYYQTSFLLGIKPTHLSKSGSNTSFFPLMMSFPIGFKNHAD